MDNEQVSDDSLALAIKMCNMGSDLILKKSFTQLTLVPLLKELSQRRDAERKEG